MISTQIIIKKVDLGVLDYVGDAVLIYTNLFDIFLGFLLSW